jgi:hypothetical protein
VTNEQIAVIIKRICQGNRERYERAQKKTLEPKWANIWANCADVAEFIEIDLLAAINGQPGTKTPQSYTVSAEVLDVETRSSAEDILEIVNAVCLEEIAYCDTANFLSRETRGACKNTIDVIQGKIAKRCRERVTTLQKQEVA